MNKWDVEFDRLRKEALRVQSNYYNVLVNGLSQLEQAKRDLLLTENQYGRNAVTMAAHQKIDDTAKELRERLEISFPYPKHVG